MVSAEMHELNSLLVRLFMTVPLFHELGKDELLELIPLAQKVPFKTGQFAFSEGDAGETMYVAVSGRFEVFRGDGAQEKLVLATIDPGEHFGEIALVEHVRRTATVRALAPALALAFTRGALEQRPALAMKLYRNMTRILSKRLRKTNNEVLLQARRVRQAEEKAREYETELNRLLAKLRPA